jgi:hypothetical protein
MWRMAEINLLWEPTSAKQSHLITGELTAVSDRPHFDDEKPKDTVEIAGGTELPFCKGCIYRGKYKCPALILDRQGFQPYSDYDSSKYTLKLRTKAKDALPEKAPCRFLQNVKWPVRIKPAPIRRDILLSARRGL